MSAHDDLPPMSLPGAKPIGGVRTTDLFIPEDTGVEHRGVFSADPAGTSLPAEIGPFRILALIGHGGMGVVYRAEQDRPARQVALKVLSPERNSPSLRKRFEHEAAVLARLSHPGIAPIYQAGVAETPLGVLSFFAMELIDGRPLTNSADERGLDVPGRIELVIQVCDAVQHAHQQGIVHRDLKPANILVDSKGGAKVLDFGIAKLVRGDMLAGEPEAHAAGDTQVGDVLGTLEYMSPEQARGRPDEVDSRSDVYSIGVILYELLAKRRPFDLANRGIVDRLQVIANDDPPRLAVVDAKLRGDLDTIVAKAMEKEKDRRYASASELAADLRRYLADEPVLARSPSAWYLLGKFARKRRALVLSAGFVTISLIAAAILSTVFWLSEREQRKQKAIAEQDALERLVQVAMQRGRWRDALDATDRALAGKPSDTSRLRLDQIRLHHILGDGQAIGFADQLAARSDLNAAERNELDFLRGDILLLRDPDSGRKLLEKAIAGPLPDADHEYALGICATSLEDALQHLRASLAIEPFGHGARTQLPYLLVLSGRWVEASEALSVAEAAFPEDPSIVIARLILDTFQGNAASFESSINRVGRTLGDAAAKDLRLASTAILTAFKNREDAPSDPSRELRALSGLLAQLTPRAGPSAASQTQPMPTLPPLFQRNFQILAAAPVRSKDRKYADELGAAAGSWPDAIFFQAWGDALIGQGRLDEAEKAYALAVNAPTICPSVQEGARVNHLLTLSLMFQMSKGERQKALRGKLLDDVRSLAERYRGPKAKYLTRVTQTGQKLGWVMSDIAWQFADYILGLAILEQWERLEPNDPVLHAELAQNAYYAKDYFRGIESAQKSLKFSLTDPLLKENVQFILKSAPAKLREQADQTASPVSGQKKP